MKIIILTISVFFVAGASAQIRSVSLQASGLTCSMCSRAIYKSLVKVPSVAKVTEDIQHSSYTIVFRDHETIVFDDLKRAVKDAGFSIAKMEVRANFDNIEIPGDGSLQLNGVLFDFLKLSDRILKGEKELILVDKDFLPEKERQKYLQLIQATASRHPAIAKSDNQRIYHVVIRQS
jgi:copper chaperone CopZ